MQKVTAVEPVGLNEKMHKAVAEAFRSDPAGKQVYQYLAARELPRPTIDLYRMRLQLNKGGFQITDLELMKFFTKLERAGAGKVVFKPLNTNEHSKFHFSVPETFLVDAAASVFVKAKAATDWTPVERALKGGKASLEVASDERVVLCRVNGATIRVRVPKNLTVHLAEEIGATLLEHARAIEAGEIG
jgi:hypothetical protein